MATLKASIILSLFVAIVKSEISFVSHNEAVEKSHTAPKNELSSEKANRNGKVFSIFSIVQFKNTGCTSDMSLGTSGTGSQFRNGTCLTSVECSNKGGSSSGECAGGFGVCCVFMTSTCGATVSQNCSYIKNPNFPSALTATTACSFTIAKCDPSVCDFRLDFETFTTNGPANTNEADNAHPCQDILAITTNTGQQIPEICGSNAGQHIYLDAGTQSGDTATLAFTFSGTFNRFWDIKVTQIPCNSNYDPPDGCLQYHTGIEGRFKTFNYDGNAHLRNQNYRICFRQEEGYCCIAYKPCSDTNAFRFNSAGSATYADGNIGSNCTGDYLVLEGSSGTGGGTLQNRYCGGFLSSTNTAIGNDVVRDCTKPFEASFVTDALSDGTTTTIANGNAGLCLEYTQEPCANARAGSP